MFRAWKGQLWSLLLPRLGDYQHIRGPRIEDSEGVRTGIAITGDVDGYLAANASRGAYDEGHGFDGSHDDGLFWQRNLGVL